MEKKQIPNKLQYSNLTNRVTIEDIITKINEIIEYLTPKTKQKKPK